MRLVRDFGGGITSVRYDSTGTYGLLVDDKEYGEYVCHGCLMHRALRLRDNQTRVSIWSLLQAAVAERRIQNMLDRFEGDDDGGE